MEKIHGVLLQFKKNFTVLFSATAESANCSLLKNLEKRICNNLQNKTSSNTLKIYRNIYRKNLSITNIALRNRDLLVSPRDFLKLSIYRYRFSTERFIVPITICKLSSHSNFAAEAATLDG